MTPKGITISSLAAFLTLLASSCDRTSTKVGVAPADVAPAAEGGEPGTPANVPISLPDQVSFNEHIQPILSEYCYHCHGPDSATRKPKDAPLRLDRSEEVFKPRENGKPVIIKGDAAASSLVQRIHSKDIDEVMPPPESHKSLSPREVALLEKWIQQGAEFQPHWSFAALTRPSVPKTTAESANPIDHFIAEKLDAAGLKMNPSEEARRFHRRLSFDLTGLPPKPEATDAFEKRYQADPDKAVAEEAKAMMATTAHAEHLTRHWLDAARYADTHGIHIDNYRSIWPYRDWVINAFKSNMPWDQFTVDQIAGDLLPDRTLDQQIATGFSRCLATTGEGGAIAEEYDAIYAKDRVDTTSAVWLGLTTGCAACHDHKFDPISQKDFYSMTAFFRNTPMSALDGNNAEHPPNLLVPAAEDRDRWVKIPGEIAAIQKQVEARKVPARAEFEKWLANATFELKPTVEPALEITLPLTEADGPIHGTVKGQAREWAVVPNRIDGPLGKAVVVNETPIDLGDIASFKRTEQVSYGGFIRVEGQPTGAVVARMNGGPGFKGWDLYLEAGRPASHIVDTWQASANKLTSPTPLTPGKWQHVMVTFDGSKKAKQAKQAMVIYIDGVAQKGELSPNTVGTNIEAQVPFQLGSRANGDSKLTAPVALQDFRFYRRVLSAAEIRSIASTAEIRQIVMTPVDQRTKQQVERLFPYYLAQVDTVSRDLSNKIDQLEAEQAQIRSEGTITLVMEEKPGEAFANILTRGVYSAKGDRVTANTPAALPAMPKDAPKNRLGLAKWLVDPANPLPARVTMNRTWYYFFGTGIVETTEDFGIMGARPSHPHLLDWLASEFMVTSKAYRQSAVVSPEKLETDPLNRLISRGPRIRLDAEQLRDMALASSDLLSPKIGGPSVKPYQPEGLWEAVAMDQSNTRFYKQDSGESLYRRSLYTFWKRTAAPASMEILNAPTREVFCVRRDRTNTPLQALVVLNDPQFVEASRQLAALAIASSPDVDLRIDFITKRLLDRLANPSERKIIRTSLESILADFTAKPDEAAKLLKVGETPAPAIPAPELAAWTMIASQILNLDETLTR
ncbi:MAG: hypothetical protein CFE26_05420 [Verrucomicrobiales bacterium VVV1]|nr:MAG: hypothetical protein CFE26_05420 [Verrucomicrobiales bacterium VVV1]